MKMYVFTSKNLTNIWAGIGAQTWAVSNASPSTMKARATKAGGINRGNLGMIYCSAPGIKSLTTPFIFTTKPNLNTGPVTNIWPESWEMPFGIKSLGTPRKKWRAYAAARALPFNKNNQNYNISSVFKVTGTAVFSPIEINENDWSLILDVLAD